MNDKPCVKCGSTDRYDDGVCKPCVNDAYDELRWHGSKEKRRHESEAAARRTLSKGISVSLPLDEKNDILVFYAPVAIEHNAEKNKQLREDYAANPEVKLAYAANRRSLNKGAKGTHTAEDWLAILDHYGNACLRCGTTENIHKDHIVALDNGGSNWPDNLQPLCGSCNSKKRTKTIDYRPTPMVSA